MIRKSRIRLDGRNIRIDEDDLDSFFLHGFYRLTS